MDWQQIYHVSFIASLYFVPELVSAFLERFVLTYPGLITVTPTPDPASSALRLSHQAATACLLAV